ncbi:hypothetical protein Poli38472_014427 [Pythium oligandrum]|uniref:Uncharacterized protein n=1 Tax=Pythium oligandrum TaxID=41045 RepID=A0A8K1FEC8_PYTOL|nr:hypothetical protein Poli38472_014427 [Pythium oligandrum]|eukprot:TMW57824.1 hypothetical protein Poli38472_014427 [Pythium oligandrum]
MEPLAATEDVGDDQEELTLSLSVDVVEPPTSLTTPLSQLAINTPSTVDEDAFRKPRQRKRVSLLTGSSSSSSSSSSGNSSFPTPFKCCGEFCDVLVQEAFDVTSEHSTSVSCQPYIKYLPQKEATSSTALQVLFNDDERQLILSHPDASALLSGTHIARSDTATSPASSSTLHVITYKSIALGKPHRQQLVTSFFKSASSFPSTSEKKSPSKRARVSSVMATTTIAQEIREGYRTRVFGDLGDGNGVANFYRQVRVCTNCYAVYTLLDRTRTMVSESGALAEASASKKRRASAAVKAKWATAVDDEVTRKEKLYLRQPRARGERKPDEPELTSTSSQPLLPALLTPKSSLTHSDPVPTESSSLEALSPSVSKHSRSLSTLPSVTSAPLKPNESVVGMDKYLRGTSKQIEPRVYHENQLFSESGAATTRRRTPGATSRRQTSLTLSVLLVDSDLPTLEFLHKTLKSASLPCQLDIETLADGSEALKAAKDGGYDLILVDRELNGGMNGLEMTKLLRQHEVQRSVSSLKSVTSAKPSRTPVLCVSSQTSAADLMLYKETGMDGCIGKPVNKDSLVQTVRAALTKAIANYTSAASVNPGVSSVTVATEALAQAKREQLERRKRRRRRLEVASSLPFPGLLETDTRDYVHGTFQMDAVTAFPYCVLCEPASRSDPTHTFFNLVVIHDLFDTWERLQILLNPIVTRYHGAIQILVWNYPGQAYTTWRPGTLLNNVYHCECFQALLQYLGPNGRGVLRDAPYYLLGVGNGGNIATRFCSLSPPADRNTRAVLLINSFTYVDAQLAQFLHDCLKVFACTPASRPDLPVYFHTRFLFSAAYLARVTTPLALNLYTAVMNPLSLDGRKALCQGALNHRDLRPGLRLTVPFINLCASQDALVDVGKQSQSLVECTGVSLVDSIAHVLQSWSTSTKKKLSSLIWLASGHEVLQECKQDVLQLVEQLVTGFFEVHDAKTTSPTKKFVEKPVVSSKQTSSREEDDVRRRQETRKSPHKPILPVSKQTYEDTFIDRVLTTVNNVVPSPMGASPPMPASNNQLTSPDKSKWLDFQAQQAQNVSSTASYQSPERKSPRKKPQDRQNPTSLTTWDPKTTAFERLSSNVIYKIGEGSKIYPAPREDALPEVKEYMTWRVQRNQKRLQRMEAKVRVIQRAFRAFYARTMALRLKRERCAIHLQRLWRAKLARTKYKGLKREDWAVRLVQRHWRGKMGRNSYKERMRQYLGAREIQRVARGGLARRRVMRSRRRIHEAATQIQRRVRQYVAKGRMFRLRRRRNAAITVQRVFRGHLGRKRFQQERDKLLFSRTQTQGITFGKQMLMEYKLYGTKLQSEVALLSSTKTRVESDAEAIVKEICEFEEGIRVLEAEMHVLSQLETETLSKAMDEQAKWQLREQKMRLDREFTQMLTQIAARKEKLSVLEEQLQHLEKERLSKEDELNGLERKLVILLEEQQQELEKIKHKQQTRSQLVLDLLPSSGTPGSMASPGFGITLGSPLSLASPSGGSAFSNNAAHTAAMHSTSAFSAQQREEANSLMESTETMMKFGFMSMSMTYFSSMNMVRAMRKIGAQHVTLDSAAVVANKRWPEYTSPQGSTSSSSIGSSFQPDVPAGGFPGQQPLQVAGWSVSDVGRWLDTLALGQYKRAFQDAAVDGALLLHLNDEDLKNTLGMEHRLHRKKILTSVDQMKEKEKLLMKQLYGNRNPENDPTGSVVSSSSVSVPSPARSLAGSVSAASSPARSMSYAASLPVPAAQSEEPAVPGAKVLVSFSDFCLLVRHGKMKQIKEALTSLPERKFDPLTVMTQYAPGVGTVYDALVEKSAFHLNKGDDNGNTPLILAAQNNNLKVAQYLVSKGANPNHQNKHGHTAGHYAMAYSFFDLGAWLLDPEKGGGRDDLLNENGLTAYDGLT